MKIEEGVRGYLQRVHDGALMISGVWGSGKSYFIKHQLLDFIKTIPYVKSDLKEDTIERIRLVMNEFGVKAANLYQPVRVSVFGIGSIKDLEHEVSLQWIDKCTGGLTSVLNKIRKGAEGVSKKFKKLNDWVDISSILGAVPPLSAIPRNTVIILDDMERFDNLKISEVEMLGFVNNLCENLGFRVIIVANEEFLKESKSPHLTFKEKVVGKSLLFTPRIVEVAQNIVSKYGDEGFKAFMSGEVIAASINPEAPLVRVWPDFVDQLGNLRTLSYAISHFHEVFQKTVAKRDELELTQPQLTEILTYSWFYIVGLSIEVKANHISCLDVRGLDKYVHTVEDHSDLEDIVLTEDQEEEQEERPTAGLAEDKYPVPQGERYAPWFYDLYIKKLAPQFLPVKIPHLIDFVVKGDELNPEIVLREYRRETKVITPQITAGDEILDKMMKGWSQMRNEDIIINLKTLYEMLREGSYSNLIGFVNSSIYLIGFGASAGITKEMVLNSADEGVDKWLASHDINDFEKSQFEAVGSSLEGDEVKEIYQHIKSKISEKEHRLNQEAVDELLRNFDIDLPWFCHEICPQAFEVRQSWGVTYPMRAPILRQISQDQIARKMDTLEPADALALQGVFRHRYSTTNLTKLKRDEEPFWMEVYRVMESWNPETLTPAQILFRRAMTADLTSFLDLTF